MKFIIKDIKSKFNTFIVKYSLKLNTENII